VAALVVLSMGAADVARVLHAASTAQTAADAAALAAAQALAIDEEGPTPEDLASEYAARNGAALEACECEPETFVATVSVRMAVGDLFLVGGDRTVLARARAEVDVPAP
jgi:Flp pilus assembly protein TadG